MAAIDIAADTLVYSDDPETLNGPPRMPLEGILYSYEASRAERTRVFYYHLNSAAQTRTIGVRVKNTGSTATALTTRGFVESPQPNPAAIVRTGHRTSVGFFAAMAAGWSAPRTLAPGEAAVFTTIDVSSGQLASGYLEVDGDGKSTLKFTVAAATSAARIASVASSGPAFPPDNFGRCGVYDIGAGDRAALHYRIGSGVVAAHRVPEGVFPNERIPTDLPEGHSGNAVYGVFTQIDATIENPTGAATTAAAYLTANGGETAATVWIDGDVLEIGKMTSGETPRPRYKLRVYDVPANGSVTSTIIGTVDPSGNGPLAIEIDDDDGDLAAPGDQGAGSIVYVPDGAPWQYESA